MAGPQIGLTSLGAAEAWLLQALVPRLETAFGAKVEIVDAFPLPREAYNASRVQHRSAVLLDVLAKHRRSDWERLLGITDVDLYTPDLNFVFGQADAERGVAVFSLSRLHATDRDWFVYRAATEAIHELAHTYGLNHCHNSRCVMWFSNTLGETDRKGTRFCAMHATALEQALGKHDTAPSSRSRGTVRSPRASSS
jgi:archaemetzincin